MTKPVLTDDCPMPWGIHKGKRMEDVPASYLIYFYDQNKCSADVRAYIEDNLDVLRMEVKRDRPNRDE